MTNRTIWNPARFISPSTADAIRSLGISMYDYASNIEYRLRARGEHDLADRMFAELALSLQERHLEN